LLSFDPLFPALSTAEAFTIYIEAFVKVEGKVPVSE